MTPTSNPLEKLELQKKIYRESLFATAKVLCGYTDTNKHTHGRMIEVLQSPSKRKLIVMPRGSFKSSISVVAYSVWILINNPNARILIDSEIYTNSKNWIREIKGVFKSEIFIDLFGDWEGSIWTEGELIVSTRTKNLKESSVVAGGVGTTKTGQHFDYVLMDDLNSQKNSETPENREKVIRHYQMNTAILEPEGTLVVVGTRYAQTDVIGHILANEVNT